MLSENNKSDIFEIILEGEGKDRTSVSAMPSLRKVPKDWHSDHIEGRLSVDVLQSENEVVVVSTMAGALTDKIEVFLHNDLLTIRGAREFPSLDFENYEINHQECFWGNFSRTIVLPADVKNERASADYKNGILIIKIPKQNHGNKIPITIVDD